MFEDPLSQEKLNEILIRLRSGLESLLGDRLVNIHLFGSQARRDAKPGSDIDVLVVIREDFDYSDLLDKTIDLVADLSLEYDVVISRSFVTLERFENEMSPFLMNVRREAISV